MSTPENQDQPVAQSGHCSRCGTQVGGDAPRGLCPRCLMAEAMAPTETPEEPAPSRPEPPALEAVQAAFPQLEVLEMIGLGGMGVVYKARQKSLNRTVALKLLAPHRKAEPGFAERFEREAQALAALSHPNIVTVHDFGQASGFFYLLMEFIDGVNLRQAITSNRFTPEEALAMVPPICDALQFAHDRGIVHRDIKPENLLLDKDGRLKVADFGIARILNEGEPQASGSASDTDVAPGLTGDSQLGTPRYMAPEQAEHPEQVDHRADIYSLGVVIYELLTGEAPNGPLTPPSSRVPVALDVRLDHIVLRALADSPELRWQTAADLRTQVETVVSEPASGVSGSQPDSPPPLHPADADADADADAATRTAIRSSESAPTTRSGRPKDASESPPPRRRARAALIAALAGIALLVGLVAVIRMSNGPIVSAIDAHTSWRKLGVLSIAAVLLVPIIGLLSWLAFGKSRSAGCVAGLVVAFIGVVVVPIGLALLYWSASRVTPEPQGMPTETLALRQANLQANPDGPGSRITLDISVLEDARHWQPQLVCRQVSTTLVDTADGSPMLIDYAAPLLGDDGTFTVTLPHLDPDGEALEAFRSDVGRHLDAPIRITPTLNTTLLAFDLSDGSRFEAVLRLVETGGSQVARSANSSITDPHSEDHPVAVDITIHTVTVPTLPFGGGAETPSAGIDFEAAFDDRQWELWLVTETFETTEDDRFSTPSEPTRPVLSTKVHPTSGIHIPLDPIAWDSDVQARAATAVEALMIRPLHLTPDAPLPLLDITDNRGNRVHATLEIRSILGEHRAATAAEATAPANAEPRPEPGTPHPPAPPGAVSTSTHRVVLPGDATVVVAPYLRHRDRREDETPASEPLVFKTPHNDARGIDLRWRIYPPDHPTHANRFLIDFEVAASGMIFHRVTGVFPREDLLVRTEEKHSPSLRTTTLDRDGSHTPLRLLHASHPADPEAAATDWWDLYCRVEWRKFDAEGPEPAFQLPPSPP